MRADAKQPSTGFNGQSVSFDDGTKLCSGQSYILCLSSSCLHEEPNSQREGGRILEEMEASLAGSL